MTSAPTQTMPAPKRIPRANCTRWDLTAIGLLVAFIMFFPILWMIITGFKSEQDAISIPPKFFFNFTLESFNEAILRSDYLRQDRKSVV